MTDHSRNVAFLGAIVFNYPSMQDFRESRVFRDPAVSIIAIICGIYGGLEMHGVREAKRAAGQGLQFPWLWLERLVDFLVGAALEVFVFLIAAWIVSSLIENANAWTRRVVVVASYLGVKWLSQFL